MFRGVPVILDFGNNIRTENAVRTKVNPAYLFRSRLGHNFSYYAPNRIEDPENEIQTPKNGTIKPQNGWVNFLRRLGLFYGGSSIFRGRENPLRAVHIARITMLVNFEISVRYAFNVYRIY